MPRRVVVAALCAAASIIALPAAAGARTKTVYAGGKPSFQKTIFRLYRHGEVNNFMSGRVTINAGDSVLWSGVSLAGGFHDVDIPAKGGSDVPLFLPNGTKVSGVNDAAGNPFWFNGLDNIGFNPQLFAPSGGSLYDGTKRVSSGLPLGKPHDFKVTFSKPGVYEYFCDVHYGMHGFVVVRAKGKAVPSAAADRKALAAQARQYVRELQRLTHRSPKGNRVSLGQAQGDGAESLDMYPRNLTVKTGTMVTFFMATGTRETHTASTGAPAYLKAVANGFQANPLDPRGVYPSSPFSAGPIPAPGTHGNGFANTGALDRDKDTTIPASGRIKFTKAGAYHYICLIHPFMRGTVTVR